MKDTSVIYSTDYQKQLSTSYYLSIQMSLDGLSFCIFDPVTNTFEALGSYHFDTQDETFSKHEEMLLTNDIFKDQYKQVFVSVETRNFTMLPKPLYDPQKAEEVLRFIGCNIKKDDKIMTDDIDMANAITIYTLPVFLEHFLLTQFSHVTIMHHTTPVVTTSLLKRENNGNNGVVKLEFTGDGVSIIATESNALKLCNKFKFKLPTDLVYIITYTAEQLKMNNIETKVIISGDIDQDGETAKMIKRFAHNVSFSRKPDYFNYNIDVPQPEYKYTNLFNMSLCV